MSTDDTLTARHEHYLSKMAAEGRPACPDCYTPLTAGRCVPCEAGMAVPVRYADAHGRIEEGVGWGTPQRDADERTVRVFEQIEERVWVDANTPPNGCRRCGRTEREHGARFDRLHLTDECFVPPTDEIRLGRILARRAHAEMRLYREINRRFAIAVAAGKA